MSASVVVSATLGLLYLIVALQDSSWIDQREQTYLLAALTASVGIALQQLIGFVLFDVIFQRRKGREAPQLLRMVVSIICYAAIFVIIFTGVFGRSLSGILATSAVLTVILGLALQDTLGNFFAGISIHVEQPFHIGDTLRLAELAGRVESVTWRATTVRTNNNSTVVLPNSRIAREAIEVYRLHSLNRRILRIPASYSVSPETVMGVARRAAASVPKISPEKPPEVRIADFSDSCITYEVMYWTDDYLWAHEIEAAIRERIWYAFQRHGIDIPFPMRHLLIEKRGAGRIEPDPDYKGVLAQVEILKPLSPEELAKVAGSLVRSTYGPGETVLRTGDTGDSMFIIHKGRAEVLAPDSSGTLTRVATLGPRNVIGEMALFTGEPRRADVRALEELEVLEIRKPVIQDILTANTRLAEAFSRIITSRQMQLTQVSEAKAEAEKTSAGETMLHRIKRFFSLG